MDKSSEGTTLLENKTMVSALVDGLTFCSHVLNMNGDSFRHEHTRGMRMDAGN